MPKSPWFPYPVRAGEVRLVCLPHAGAGASSYRAWAATAPAGMSVCPAQPPGREGRGRQPAHDDVHEFVRDLADHVPLVVPEPFALFGHSTGALTAFVLARELRRRGGPTPRHVFVAGRGAPHVPMPRTPLAEASVGQLRDVLRRLGGTPEEVLAQDRLLLRLQPLLAADFRLNESYEFPGGDPLDVPITAYSASGDGVASVAEMAQWREHTSAQFDQVTLDGGHFAVFEQAVRVQADMMERLAAGRQARPGPERMS